MVGPMGTPEHRTAGLPWVWGDRIDVLPDADGTEPGGRLLTRAVTVEASMETVFLWLCQLRRAPYSYDLLDNFGRRSPRRPDPAMLDLAVGQDVMTIFTLTAFEPGRSLTIRMKPGGPTRLFGGITVHYFAEPVDDARTRLAVVMWMPPVGRLLANLRRNALAWGDLFMMRKQLLTLKSLAERSGAGTGA